MYNYYAFVYSSHTGIKFTGSTTLPSLAGEVKCDWLVDRQTLQRCYITVVMTQRTYRNHLGETDRHGSNVISLLKGKVNLQEPRCCQASQGKSSVTDSGISVPSVEGMLTLTLTCCWMTLNSWRMLSLTLSFTQNKMIEYTDCTYFLTELRFLHSIS